MKNSNKTPLAIAISGTLVSGLTSTVTQADTFSNIDADPFKTSELLTGYMQTAKADSDKQGSSKMKQGSCGEGGCGGSMKMKGSEEKTAEGSCAGSKPMPAAMNKKKKSKLKR